MKYRYCELINSTKMMECDIAVVGGGIVGASVLYHLSKEFPGQKLLLLEKESELAFHQTGRNSGVIHSGIYYPPSSAKASMCIKGRKQLVDFAKEYNISHEICGKIIVATRESEWDSLNQIYQNGLINGIEGIEMIDQKRIRELEPECAGLAGVHVPCAGIIDFREVTKRLAELACATGTNRLLTGNELLDIKKDNHFFLKTNQQVIQARAVVFCGGLFADRLALRSGYKIQERIVAFRGDYYELNEVARSKVRNLIYPVPDPAFPFLGVHLTRMVDGNVECGPNAVFSFKREGYSKLALNWRDASDALSYRGTWRLFFRNARFGIREYRRAFSKKLFLKSLQDLVPSLQMKDLEKGRSGVRAILLSTKGDSRDDFRIEGHGNEIHVLNAPSPAATASLAIGEHIAQIAKEQFVLRN